jgi:hypothetical protein
MLQLSIPVCGKSLRSGIKIGICIASLEARWSDSRRRNQKHLWRLIEGENSGRLRGEYAMGQERFLVGALVLTVMFATIAFVTF